MALVVFVEFPVLTVTVLLTDWVTDGSRAVGDVVGANVEASGLLEGLATDTGLFVGLVLADTGLVEGLFVGFSEGGV